LLEVPSTKLKYLVRASASGWALRVILNVLEGVLGNVGDTAVGVLPHLTRSCIGLELAASQQLDHVDLPAPLTPTQTARDESETWIETLLSWPFSAPGYVNVMLFIFMMALPLNVMPGSWPGLGKRNADLSLTSSK
jgi:hypothetical protein